MKLLIASLLLICAAAPAQMTSGSRIEIRVTGVPNERGTLMIALFDAPNGFPSDSRSARLRQQVEHPGRDVAVIFDDVPSGTYAIAVFHDADGNGVLNTNFLGIPTEAWGASNDAKGHFGPPSFASAAFHLDEAATLSLTIPVAPGAHW